MSILILDLETTGLLTDTCDIVSFGTCRVDTGFKKIYNIGGALVWDSNYQLTEEATAVNGLSKEFLELHGIHPKTALASLTTLMNGSEYICCHNSAYDKKVLEARFKHYDMVIPDKQWLDTRTDLPFKKGTTSKRLAHLSVDHGIYNPFPHDSVFDAVTTAQLLLCYPIEEVIKRAESPNIKVAMEVPFSDNDFAKQKRFYWDKELKLWCKELKAFELEDERKTSRYPITILSK